MSAQQQMVPRPTGWTIFIGTVLLLVGCFNVIWGLMALLRPRIITVTGDGVVILDLRAWGWAYIIVGALMIAASIGLFTVQRWGRVLAIIFAGLNALIAVAYFPAYPLWSLLVIVLDVLVIYQLSVRWQQPLPGGPSPGPGT